MGMCTHRGPSSHSDLALLPALPSMAPARSVAPESLASTGAPLPHPLTWLSAAGMQAHHRQDRSQHGSWRPSEQGLSRRGRPKRSRSSFHYNLILKAACHHSAKRHQSHTGDDSRVYRPGGRGLEACLGHWLPQALCPACHRDPRVLHIQYMLHKYYWGKIIKRLFSTSSLNPRSQA